MRKIIVSMHITLDGFVAGPNGEMDWISFDDELFDFVEGFTDQADTALYGRVTYQMMDSYWPAAAEQTNASKHDVTHSRWYKSVTKLVVSASMSGQDKPGTQFIGEDIAKQIEQIKQQPGKDILIFGSPSVVHYLTHKGLIDDYWLFVNPVLMGQGIPMFKDITERVTLNFLQAKTFACGVTGLHYEKR